MNLDKGQLGASLLKGDLTLENMKLRQDIFDDSPMPFRLDYGQVGRIYLKIPIWDIFNSPLIIQVENVFGVIRVNNDWKPSIE